tara:strand:- start:1757 stop:3865 length:2109 start_codon:yes stop_codon:yes gene_type:complete
MESLEVAYLDFKQGLMNDSVALGKPQREEFFENYSSLGSEAGEFTDLEYSPIKFDDPNRPYQIDGYSLEEDSGTLHLIICNLNMSDEIQTINIDEIDKLFRRAQRFYLNSLKDGFTNNMEESDIKFEVSNYFKDISKKIKRVKITIFTDAELRTRKKSLESKTTDDIEFILNILDFKRYSDINNSLDGDTEIEINIPDLNESPIPCLQAFSGSQEYKSYLCVMPGTLLAKIYGIYGAKILESNVRSYLQNKTKVNRKIRETIEDQPDMFFAYNNGLTVTASEIKIDNNHMITSLRNFQIVNGGQTTASILNAYDNKYRKNHPKFGDKIDISKIFVQMKLSVIEKSHHINEDENTVIDYDNLVSNISRFSNSQNKINESDFFSNSPFHVRMEQFSRTIFAPKKENEIVQTKWFYERARGQYNSSYRTESQKKKHMSEFPKQNKLMKSELGLLYFTYNKEPFKTKAGQEKSFAMFAEETEKDWAKNEDNYNEKYFKDLIAKKILFNSTQRIIGNADWYKENQGYRREKVVYTLSLLMELINSKSMIINFQQIWDKQEISDELSGFIERLSHHVSDFFNEAPNVIEMKNISEYAKKEKCWDDLRNTNFEYNKDEISHFSISLEESVELNRDNRTNQRETSTLSELIHIFPHLAEIKRLSEAYRLKSPKNISAIKRLNDGHTDLSRPQLNALKYLLEKLKDRGHEY